jgi:hypothetical protein
MLFKNESWPGVEKFTKNLDATSEFLAPEEWHEASSSTQRTPQIWSNLTIIWRFFLGVYKLITQGKTAIIMLEILGAAVQNLLCRDLCTPDQDWTFARELPGRHWQMVTLKGVSDVSFRIRSLHR